VETLASDPATLGVNSWAFGLLGVLGIVLARTLTGAGRRVALLACNLAFLAFFVLRAQEAAVLAGFVGATWGLARWKAARADRLPAALMGVVSVALWTFLFLVRDPELLGAANPFHHLPVRLVGVSYLVFRSISYVNEVELVEDRSLLGYVNYLLFFPTLLSGPIERWRRHSQMETGDLRPDDDGPGVVLPALHRIANGLILKFVLADNLWSLGIAGLQDLETVATPLLWFGLLFQFVLLYLDFAGYCHIVLGLAALMGFPIVENFDRPFLAANMQEFWERWHISLSAMVRDYVFTPLSKVVIMRAPRTSQFALITGIYFFSTVLIGVWHDTTLGFLLFGVLHGAALVAYQLKKKNKKRWKALTPFKGPTGERLGRWLAVGSTYVFLSFTMLPWILPTDRWMPVLRGLLPW